MHACILHQAHSRSRPRPRLHDRLPALPHSIFLCGAAACHLLAVKHQGIFKAHLARVVRLQAWKARERRGQVVTGDRWAESRFNPGRMGLDGIDWLTCLGVEKLFFAVHAERLDTHGERQERLCRRHVSTVGPSPRYSLPPDIADSQTHTAKGTDMLAPGVKHGSGKGGKFAQNAIEWNECARLG